MLYLIRRQRSALEIWEIDICEPDYEAGGNPTWFKLCLDRLGRAQVRQIHCTVTLCSPEDSVGNMMALHSLYVCNSY